MFCVFCDILEFFGFFLLWEIFLGFRREFIYFVEFWIMYMYDVYGDCKVLSSLKNFLEKKLFLKVFLIFLVFSVIIIVLNIVDSKYVEEMFL